MRIEYIEKESIELFHPSVGDFLVRNLKNEIHIDRYASIVLQKHDKCNEVKELRDILNKILDS